MFSVSVVILVRDISRDVNKLQFKFLRKGSFEYHRESVFMHSGFEGKAVEFGEELSELLVLLT
jgi:hypothetical protein